MADTTNVLDDDGLIEDITIDSYDEVTDSDIGSAGGETSLDEQNSDFESDFDTNLDDLTDLDDERI